ncbi:hypothetical protein BKA62DRAFT_828441 [Auriculariales sp. MPI-PUGE-AT-0066]|nr:hypothetical protein BKA62DRAFT_828441 [Auriculariales sp. MPI-PUGE-AT-0066]
MLATALLNGLTSQIDPPLSTKADIVAPSNVLKRAAPNRHASQVDTVFSRSSSELRSQSEALDPGPRIRRLRLRTVLLCTSIAEAATLQPQGIDIPRRAPARKPLPIPSQQYASVTSTPVTSFAPAIRPLPVPPRLETIVTAPLPPPKAIPRRTRRGKDDEWTQPRHDESFWLPVRQPEVLRTDSAASLLAQISSDDQEDCIVYIRQARKILVAAPSTTLTKVDELSDTSSEGCPQECNSISDPVAPAKLHDDIVAALALVRHCDAVHVQENRRPQPSLRSTCLSSSSPHAVEDSDFTDEEIHLLTPFSDQSPALSRRGKI